MAARIEWRTRREGDDALLFVGEFGEDSNTVLKTWGADPVMLTDFLNDMAQLDTAAGLMQVNVNQREPQHWGQLVLARSPSGDVLTINPELYWQGIYYWFRSRGTDPHPWRGRK